MIYLDVTSFTARPELGDKIVRVIQEKIIEELKDTFPDVRYRDNSDLMDTLSAIREATGEKFFFIIDEWDAICREFPDRRKMKGDASGVAPTILDEYVMLLRRLFKTQESDEVFAGAYLTGILPIKKYNEVMKLCQSYCMDIKEMEQWYDGYRIGRALSISSLSVISMAVGFRRGDIKWNYNFSPKQRSPASPRPGTMYLCSLSCGSMAPHHTVVLSLGNVLRM